MAACIKQTADLGTVQNSLIMSVNIGHVCYCSQVFGAGTCFWGDSHRFWDISSGNYLLCMKTRVDKYGKAGKGTPSFHPSCPWMCVRKSYSWWDRRSWVKPSAEWSSLSISQWINVDSTADITHVEQLTITLRYVPPDGCTEERFVKATAEKHSSEQNQPFRWDGHWHK